MAVWSNSCFFVDKWSPINCWMNLFHDLCIFKSRNIWSTTEMAWNGLKDISTPDISTPSFNPGPFNPRLFNHEFLNHGVEKFMVEKSGVEMSFNLLERWHFNPRLFNHELFNPMVQKFMVEKSGVERSRIEAWGWKVRELRCPSTECTACPSSILREDKL